ncbi:hypothetical protein GO755_26075 [Spirosoma sp. HMF4905]|uniref:DUF3575 domain-containing protein n=1 Tax=Spirosoma arboris TaxID=2682092 RepID=A0A7K1SIA2_9BACT|nr:hypothetical protein [Spirosoma arboris]MVM33532.1 hypothetical protein [Spirosoma arboris]
MIRRLLMLWFTSVTVYAQTIPLAPNRIFDTGKDSTNVPITPVLKSTRLIKAGLNVPLFRQSTFTPNWITAGLDVTAEQKITNGLTLVGSLESNYSFRRGLQLYTLEMPLGLRYYFSIGKRMRQRADRHSFFSHYIGFQTYNVLFTNLHSDNSPQYRSSLERYYRGQLVRYNTNEGILNESFNMMQNAYFQVGTQLQLGHSKYLDINAVVPIPGIIYHKTDYTISTPAYVNIKYGLFW